MRGVRRVAREPPNPPAALEIWRLCVPAIGASGTVNNSGSANYAFGDGSVPAVRYGQTLYPLNLWVVTEHGWTDFAVCGSY